MLSLVSITDALGITTLQLDEFPYPLQKCDWDYGMESASFQKQQTYGRWDAYARVGVMNIEMEGEIVTDTTTAYWTARRNLVELVVPNSQQLVRKHSRIYIELENGSGVSYYADVQLEHYQIPIAATGSPTVSPFQFSWTCNKGYWTVTNTQALVRL